MGPEALPGPKFDRGQLEVLSSGRISSVFGPRFAAQDGYHRQVRMPEPPLLLADRVTGIDAVPCSMRTGTIWTETDVRPDSWYLSDEGRMPAGIMIEAGQADLLLISWLGIDMHNRGERVYRLLGCELTYHGRLPVPGETLCYDIHVDGHAQQGDIRLFFFHYDCRVNGELRLTVRHGQAGFFTDQELANSGGVLWSPETGDHRTDGPLDPPAVACEKRSFSRADLEAFSEGRVFDCFGRGFEWTQTHVRTPRIHGGRLLLLHRVTDFDPRGGAWGRGYLRAEQPLAPDDWFLQGHFKNDPCMPGTLMFEGCLQAMAFYLTAMGFTLERDGWSFEPVTGEKYLMHCRGQATPKSRLLVYEVFVEEVVAGPIPTIYADLLCTVDGLKAFHARRVGLRLAPDWPLERWKQLGPPAEQETGAPVPLRTLAGLVGHREPKPVASAGGFPFDYHSLLACAWGAPSRAFGPLYAAFDGTRRAARLPGPPYHFMSRITRIDGPIGALQVGTSIEAEYDIPERVWYFAENGFPTMPFCVLMEAVLQPCGWLASFVGSATSSDADLLFRNLDGTGTLAIDLRPGAGTLRTRVKLLNISRSAGMIIETFAVEAFLDDRRIYEMNTVFGFFPPAAFENQVGLPVTDAERTRLMAPGNVHIDLTARPEKYCAGSLRLAEPMLLMLDRITGYWPEGGRQGLGYARAEKDVETTEWFFKAHFFQDPVQPGSLGIEALCQLLQFVMLEKGMGDGIPDPRFEPIMLERPVTWKYRGQVVPKNRLISTELEIVEVGEDARGRYAVAEAWLWVDHKRIYHAKNLGMRIVPGKRAGEKSLPEGSGERSVRSSEETLDPAVDRWLLDHCPTWTLPALPLMSMVDRLAGAAEAATGREASVLSSIQVKRWLPFPGGPVRLRTEVTGQGDELEVVLLAWRDAGEPALSRFEPVASGRARVGAPAGPAPAAFAPLEDALPVPDPYAEGSLFHGPGFQYLTALRMGPAGATAELRGERGQVPRGTLHQGLLDAMTHAIPHDALWRWSPDIPRDQVAYPYRIPVFQRFAPLPDAGVLRVEVRFAGFDGSPRHPAMDLQLIDQDRVLVSLRLVEVLLPKGPLGSAPPGDRRAFLRDRRHVPSLALSRLEDEVTRLRLADVQQSDWLPGTVACIYGVPSAARGDLLAQVAVREHIARRAFVHPATVSVADDLSGGVAAVRPLRRHPVQLTRSSGGAEVFVADAGPARQDLEPVRRFWDRWFNVGRWPVEDLYYGLIERFVSDVILVDPEGFERVKGRSCLYLANHQVGIESLLFSILCSALSGVSTVTLAKAEHRTSWLGQLIQLSFSYPGVADPNVISFFEREDRAALMQIVGALAAEMQSTRKNAMVHVEGTRALSCRTPVVKMSSAFIDMALAVDAPIIPVRFVGGLPVEPLETRLEFPVGFARQDYWIGSPILPGELAAMPYKDRKLRVIDAINRLGPDNAEEVPSAPDPAFADAVQRWIARTGASPEHATLLVTLATLEAPEAEVRTLLEGARAGRLEIGADPRARWLGQLARRLFGERGPRVVDLPRG